MMEDFADRVRKAQDAATQKQQAQRSADDKLREEAVAAEAEISKAASLLARALRSGGVLTDVAVKHYESRIRIKRFGKQVREEATHHILEGWVFGETLHTFQDPDSQTGYTETTLRGFILAEDGGVHRCDVNDVGASTSGTMTLTVRDPWGGSIHNGPMKATMMAMHRSEVLDGLAQLAVKHRITPSRLSDS